MKSKLNIGKIALMNLINGSIAILLLGFLTTLSFSGCSPQKYSSGRDTIDSFGDGRYQILRSRGGAIKVLHDGEKHNTISMSVVSWRQKNDLVCVLTRDVCRFIVVEYNKGKVTSYASINEIPQSEKPVFEKMLTDIDIRK